MVKVRVLSSREIPIEDSCIEVDDGVLELRHLMEALYVERMLHALATAVNFLLSRRIDRVQSMMMDYILYIMEELGSCIGGKMQYELSKLKEQLESRRYKRNTVPLQLWRDVWDFVDRMEDLIHPLIGLCFDDRRMDELDERRVMEV